MFWVKKKDFEKLQNEVTHLSSEFNKLKRIMLFAKDEPTCRFYYEYDDREGLCNVVYIYPGRNRFEEFRFVLKEISGHVSYNTAELKIIDGLYHLTVNSGSLLCPACQYKFIIDVCNNKYVHISRIPLKETGNE